MALKVKPSRDPEYRAFVRQHPCALNDYGACDGPIQAAHVAPRGEGRMGGKTSDYYCAPLCQWHHIEYLHRGRASTVEIAEIRLMAQRILVGWLDEQRSME